MGVQVDVGLGVEVAVVVSVIVGVPVERGVNVDVYVGVVVDVSVVVGLEVDVSVGVGAAVTEFRSFGVPCIGLVPSAAKPFCVMPSLVSQFDDIVPEAVGSMRSIVLLPLESPANQPPELWLILSISLPVPASQLGASYSAN